MYCFNVKVSSSCFGIDEKGIEPIHFVSKAEVITVRELITNTVRKQILILQKENSVSIKQAIALLERQYLTSEEINSMAQKGSINVVDNDNDKTTLDVKSEIERALVAFRKRNFFITVDGYQPQILEEKISLSDNTQVLFIRLMPLVGG